MRNKPITIELDRHGDPMPAELPANATSRELAEIAASERKSPRFSRLLAASPSRTSLPWLVITGVLAVAGCATNATDADIHALSSCAIDIGVKSRLPPNSALQCESACQGVTYAESKSGPLCTSLAFTDAADHGGPLQTCASVVTLDDGSMGCCELLLITDNPSMPSRYGFEFFACDGGQ